MTGSTALAARARGLWPFLTEANARRLVRAYGTRLDRILGDARDLAALGERFGGELTAAEVRYLMRHEFAETADDVLWRRSKLGLRLEPAGGRGADAIHGNRRRPRRGRVIGLSRLSGGEIAESSACDRPGHDLDARVSVRRSAGRRSDSRSSSFRRSIPQPGWVEHDPQGIWTTSVATARAAMASAGVTAEDVAAIGITNQRETTDPVGPRDRQADPQCDRLAGPPHA